FIVNLQIGDSGDDIAFHFNPRFEDGGYVVCNTKENGHWATEETEMEMPFEKARPFELCFLVQNSGFKVMVNKNFFMEYSHRIPYHLVDTIVVTGSVQLSMITFQNSFAAPVEPVFSTMQSSMDPGLGRIQNVSQGLWPVHQAPVAPRMQPVECPNSEYPIPFFDNIPDGFYPSKSIKISGTVLPNANSFYINLLRGSDIAFHMNTRFDENTVTRNTQINGSWGREETILFGKMPFNRGQDFTVSILCEHHCFRISVNGKDMCNYWHRLMDLKAITRLEVAGDVQLTDVDI
ncbi:galectin-9 isoform X1, partial [Sigmodon hispidus]